MFFNRLNGEFRYYLDYCKLVFQKIKLYLDFRTKGLPQASVLRDSGLFKVCPRDPMSKEEFCRELLKLAKPTREFQVSEGGFDPLSVTKISGQPWWPEGLPRPTCKDGHSMNFVAQVLLSDVPLPDMPANTLVSFHYCDECTMAGRMSFGCFDKQNRGYDLTILHDTDKANADTKGLLVPSLTKSYIVSFRDVEEVPGGLCEDADIKFVNLPQDFPQQNDDFDEDIYPGLKHVHNSKIGGWPSWAQNPEWPLNNGERYKFLGQLDWKLFEGTPWCIGGYAYLFIAKETSVLLK